MKGADRIILVALPLVALAVGFWFLVLAPKSREAGELQDEINSLEASIASSEAELAAAEDARRAFPRNYADLVSLGAAVPEDDDQATLIHDLAEIGRRDGVNFRSFEVTPASETSPAPPPPTETAAPATGDATTTTTTTEPAVASEASAATLPLGATVGPAGLPLTPYSLTYFGGFFDMADLFSDLDARVKVSPAAGKKPVVQGRLMTIDAFSMEADPIQGFPRVKTDLDVTTYLVPADQGIAAGASPAGPAPVDPSAGATPVTAGAAAPAPPAAAVTP